MYFLLFLFFGSLLGIVFMIGRKLVVAQNGEIRSGDENLIEVSSLEEWKDLAVKNMKNRGYNLLVAVIRYYVRSVNFLMSKFQKIKSRVKNMRGKSQNSNPEDKREVSGFLKRISEYKHKVKKIKHKIKQEENL